MFGIGVQELGLIIVIALLVFGPKRMPELARMLGRGMGEFRKASNDLRESLALDEIQNELRDAAGTIKKDLDGLGVDEILKPQTPLKKAAADPDRPAQAGDDLPTAAATAATVSAGAAVSAATAADESDAGALDPAVSHSGELPLGNDHEHHSEPEAETEPAGGPAADRADDERG